MAALARIKGTAHAELRLCFLWDCLQYFYFNEESHKALAVTRQMAKLSKASGSKRWHRKAVMFEGILLADIGNVADALLLLSQALEQAREMCDVEGELSTLVNMGVALNYGALHAEAIPCLTRAIEIAKSESQPLWVARALLNLGQSYQYLGQFQEAFAAVTMALEATPEPTDLASTFSAVTRGHTYVELALELGKLELARKQAKTCAARAQRGGSTRGKGLADIATGLCEVFGGKRSEVFLFWKES